MEDRAFIWGIIQFFIGCCCAGINYHEIFRKGKYRSSGNWVFFICGILTILFGLKNINENI